MGLETFAPEPKIVQIRDRSIEILPVRMKEMPAFARGVLPAVVLLKDGKMLEAVAAYGDGLRDGIAAAARLEKDWIAELFPDEFVRLFEAVLEVNADFFARRVLPETTSTATRLKEVLASLNGENSSPGSSSADTATETSSS